MSVKSFIYICYIKYKATHLSQRSTVGIYIVRKASFRNKNIVIEIYQGINIGKGKKHYRHYNCEQGHIQIPIKLINQFFLKLI